MVFSPAFSKAFRPTFDPGAKARFTLTLQPDAAAGIDTYVQSSLADTNFGTNAGITLRGGGAPRRGIVKFSGISAIPVGASIVSATINFWASIGQPAGNDTISLWRILAANSSWTETGATYNHQVHASSTDWAGGHSGCGTSGTDYSATLFGSFAITSGDAIGTAYSAALNTTEFGLMLATNNGIVITALQSLNYQIASSDNATVGYRPQLIIVYEI